MSLSNRDRKLLLVLVPLVFLLGYWFLVLGPQRADLASLQQERSKAESARDTAVARAGTLEQSRNDYARDYATVVRLGKAIPSGLDMPSLLVQLESAAKGTKIRFERITAGPRTSATAVSGSGTTGAAPPVAAGGQPAQSSAGKPVEQANGAAKDAEATNSAKGADAGSTGSSATPGGAASGGAAGSALDTVPLNFTFTGSFFDLAEFLHQVKRFVRVANGGNINVKGRLMTIDGIKFDSESFPAIKADVTATAYLSPKSQGTTGGATPQGPAASASPPATPTSAPATEAAE